MTLLFKCATHIRGLALGQFVISLNFARLRIAQVGRYSQRWVGPGYGPSRFFDIARDWPGSPVHSSHPSCFPGNIRHFNPRSTPTGYIGIFRHSWEDPRLARTLAVDDRQGRDDNEPSANTVSCELVCTTNFLQHLFGPAW